MKLKVLYVPYWYHEPDGKASQKSQLVREQVFSAALYEDVMVLVVRRGVMDYGAPRIRRYTCRGVSVTDVVTPPSSRHSAGLFTLLRALLSIWRSWGLPQVIHAQDMAASPAGKTARLLGIPYVACQYWSGFHHRLLDRREKRLSREAFNGARVILTSSPDGRSDLRKYGIRGDIRWIPNSLDTGLFSPPLDNTRSRDLLHYSNFGQDEGVEYIIEAFSRIQRFYPDTVLHLAGEGGWKHEMRKLASERLKWGSYSFPGALEPWERAVMLKTCCGFVYPSRNSFHSMDLLEALSCRCPSVATEAALKPFEGKRDWVLPVRPGSPGDLAAMMRKVLDNSHDLDTARTAETVRGLFSRERTGVEVHRAHLDALAGTRRSLFRP